MAVEPGRLISYTFGEGSIDTTITWRIEPAGTGTRRFLEHAGFDPDFPLGRRAYEAMGEGWPHRPRPHRPALTPTAPAAAAELPCSATFPRQ